ncbi:MAG: hypothetical protein NC221_08645 [Duncaniella sp.]|nr:hypothetical protein [Duncaniella sp.]
MVKDSLQSVALTAMVMDTWIVVNVMAPAKTNAPGVMVRDVKTVQVVWDEAAKSAGHVMAEGKRDATFVMATDMTRWAINVHGAGVQAIVTAQIALVRVTLSAPFVGAEDIGIAHGAGAEDIMIATSAKVMELLDVKDAVVKEK